MYTFLHQGVLFQAPGTGRFFSERTGNPLWDLFMYALVFLLIVSDFEAPIGGKTNMIQVNDMRIR
jgi:hypothetical protein